MQPELLGKLPTAIRSLVDQIESHCEREICIRYRDDPFQEHEYLLKPDGGCVRITREGGARILVHFEGTTLAELGVEYRLKPPVQLVILAHELLHLKHLLVDGAVFSMRYLDWDPGAPNKLGDIYNLIDSIEHIHVYRRLQGFGLADPSVENVRNLLSALSSVPVGLPRRAVGLMSWLQASLCFPQTLREFAMARLLEVDLLDDARKLEAAVRPLLKENRIPFALACIQAIGIPTEDMEFNSHHKINGEWRNGRQRVQSNRRIAAARLGQ
ncbi:MAG: hypothetical protein ABSH49_12190 [Bryobacteraceae bacterium]|jgi:hypothetical protein